MLEREINLRRNYCNKLIELFDTVLEEVNLSENPRLMNVMNSVNEVLNEDMSFLGKFTPEEINTIFNFK